MSMDDRLPAPWLNVILCLMARIRYSSFSFDCGTSRAILCYDESAGVAHFYWVGVDLTINALNINFKET